MKIVLILIALAVVGTKIVAKFASEGFILIQPNNVPLATLQVFVSNAHSMVYA